MQRISIEKLKVPALIGVYDWERTQKTELLMTLHLLADVVKASKTDSVADTIDYAEVAEFIKGVASNTSYELLEALGRELCEHALSQFPIEKIQLTIEKPGILADAQCVAVTMAFDQAGPALLLGTTQ